ncbi:hypothetical protein [Methanobacterium formicicum]|uniref:Uncharacterized protein n=1 Tax=Methanobacterium formicicum (strain DSM 3637 / PP1) TaxID=1204725 RepID=K2RVS7_METFP|nr:hypothetical protein [Methanobacterium formicicum]EKF86840.1 hypothetical protein A994_01100 [Methanobacterium formicicum DSM 3637]
MDVKILGRTGYQIDNLIEKELIKGVKSGKELKNKVLDSLGKEVPKHFQKAYDRSLIKLLEKEKIMIVSYDPSMDSRRTKQAFKSDPLVFDSSKRLTRPDILELLKNLTKSNRAYQNIRSLFKNKLEDLKTFYFYRWSILENGTFSETPDQLEDMFSNFRFFEYIQDMITDLEEKDKEAYIRYYYVESVDEDVESYDTVWSEIQYIIDKVEERDERKRYDMSYDYDDLQIEKEKRSFEEEDYFKYDLKEIIEHMASILILLDKYKNYPNLKIWFYPFSSFQFDDIWNDVSNSYYKTYSSFDNKILTHSVYTLKIDKYGYWDDKEALKEGGYKNQLNSIKSPDKEFEHVIDIILTYPKEEKAILMGILAKGLSDESGSIQVFGEFYRKMQNVDYQKRLTTVLGLVEL